MESIVALDIETTGLDPREDAIIEIGAVRFKDHRIESEWSTLVNPGRRIPPFITQLTGITDQMVLKAPPISRAVRELADFVGDSPVLGQNVRFDLGFLQRLGVLKDNLVLDTYELAAVLLPGASRYNLGALAAELGAPMPVTHRALDDARATRAVFLRLYEEALRLPLPILAEIIRLSDHLDWGAHWPLRQALIARKHEITSARALQNALRGPLFSEEPPGPSAGLQPTGDPLPLISDDLAALLEPGGPFDRNFPHYEYRSQQVAMLRAVSEALSEGRHLLVEAGTGTGKSMAYLIPAAYFALQNQRRVVISTNTINLQDQLINKDIPDLIKALDLDLRAVVLKGRANYLCPRRLESLRRRKPETVEEMRVLAKVLVWLPGTRTGDRGEINLNGPGERDVWSRLSAEDESCNAEECLRKMGTLCPFYRARQAALSAHLVIVNHALLLADVATNNRVLPEYEYLIVDEAHHLESATTNALSFEISAGDIERLLRELGGARGGALGWLLNAAQPVLQPSEYAVLNEMVNQATDLAFQLDHHMHRFFSAIQYFLRMQREGQDVGMYSHQERITPATRSQPDWAEVEMAWDEASHAAAPLTDLLGKLAQGLAEIQGHLAEEDDELYSTLANLYRRLREMKENLNALVFEPAAERIYWAESTSNGHLSLHAAPLFVGGLMEQHLWRQKTSVILTSATLTTGGDFDYLRGRLNAVEAGELALGSPFDFENAAMLYLVNDITEPHDRHNYQKAVENGLIQLCRASGGRALVLFTSYDQLKRTSQAISPALARSDILVYEQGEGASPHTLLETFRSSQRAVLLGTRSFWEGVDVPGEALSVLVIVKLPFDVPSDPIVAARAETFEDSFNQYSLPEAILRFRQGFGRLIRTQSDRGVVVVFDRRILSKRYGRAFLDSLPPCTTVAGSLNDLGRAISRWLN